MTTRKPGTAVLALLDKRATDQTVCTNEVARSLADAGSSPSWQGFMPAVHEVVDELLADGVVEGQAA